MLEFLLLTLTPAPLLSLGNGALPAMHVAATDGIADRIAAAGKDAAKLEALAEELQAAADEAGAAQAWEALVRLDGSHAKAREALRHRRYDGQWFETYAALAAYRRKEAKTMLETKGLVRLGGEWVPEADRPFLRMGWERLEGGAWARPGTQARLAKEDELRAKGWEQQDHVWIDPADFDKWRAGQWKVGDAWLGAEEADAARSKIGDWWQVPGEQFIALTTVARESAQWAPWWADQVVVDLERLTGLVATDKVEFVVLDSIAQYNAFAAGDGTRLPAETSGFSSLHYAFFADSWVDATTTPGVFRGTGVAWWDPSDANLAPYGQHAVRHAAALAWLEAVDPSWDAVSLMVTDPTGGFPGAKFWGEKRIPRWLRYGAASYCERYFEDPKAAENGGDPMWSRTWALSNLTGELDAVDRVIDLPLSLQDVPGSTRLLHQAGLVVHYLLNGEDRAVTKAHKAWRSALVSGERASTELADLEEALRKAESKIHRLVR